MTHEQIEDIERSLRRVADMVKQKGRVILSQFPITPSICSASMAKGKRGYDNWRAFNQYVFSF